MTSLSKELAIKAMQAWNNRNPSDAETLIDDAVQQSRTGASSEDVARVARVLRVMKKFDLAIELLRDSGSTACAQCQLELARNLIASNKWGDAQRALADAHSIAPPNLNSTICSERIRLLARQKHYSKARQVAAEGLQKQPESQAIRSALAFMLRKEQEGDLASASDRYWQARKDYVYLNVATKLMKLLGPSAQTALDVGSAGTPTVMNFAAPRKYSVDWGNPYVHQEVISANCNYLEWSAPESMHIASCMQVLEHIPDPKPFARKLLEDSEVVIASVPHLERPGGNPGHLHNMITREKFADWFAREPNFLYIAKELSGDERMVGVWDRTSDEPFADLSETGPTVERFRLRWNLDDAALPEV